MDPPAADIPVMVFAKAPVAGYAKTRLAPLLGAARAAELQRHLTRRAVATALAARVGPVTLFCSPDCGHPFFAECSSRYGVPLAPQSGPDLGERMLAALAAALATRAAAIVIGTDCPVLAPEDLRAAAAGLTAGHDLTIAPAEDGGYALIGLRAPVPTLFRDVAWGGPEVLATTRRRAASLGLRCHETRTVWDVDEPADYLRMLAAGCLPGWTDGPVPSRGSGATA